VWDGDQVLYEISTPGASNATAAQMEADTGIAAPLFINANNGVNVFFPYGRVMYEHGGGIDAPLGVVRMEYSDTLHEAQVILPHANWRGSYARGSTQGSCFVYGNNGQAVIPPPDSTPSGGDRIRPVGGTSGGSAEHCINVDWPAAYSWSARQYRRGYSGPVSWMGSLIYESRDASGLYYRRNRYYDSEAGRFTQEDPLGLAGGINLYGFADGDPITYDDPLGLMVCFRGANRSKLIDATKNGTNTTFDVDPRSGCIVPSSIQDRGGGNSSFAALRRILIALASDNERHVVGFVDATYPCESMGSCTFGRSDSRVSLADLRVRYQTCDRARFPRGWATTLEQTVVHELLGHQTDSWLAILFQSEGHAIDVENIYHRATTREPKRCGHAAAYNPYVPQR
jgi:RHS repeat-associated protein